MRRLRGGQCGGTTGASVVSGTEAKFDDGARVRNQFCLPAIISLQFLHGGFGLRIPVTASGIAREITGFDQSRLNLRCAGIINGPLPHSF